MGGAASYGKFANKSLTHSLSLSLPLSPSLSLSLVLFLQEQIKDIIIIRKAADRRGCTSLRDRPMNDA